MSDETQADIVDLRSPSRTEPGPWEARYEYTSFIELELTSFCNLNCDHCNRSMAITRSSDYLSVEQVRKFVQQSIDAQKRWARIRIVGGEPTLHPQFFECIEALLEYTRTELGADTIIDLFSNGSNRKIRGILAELPARIRCYTDYKSGHHHDFAPFHVAPVDLDDFSEFDDEDFAVGCVILDCCGPSLSHLGFFPCAPASGIARVLGWDTGIKELREVTADNLRAQLHEYCRRCGHFLSHLRRRGEPALTTSAVPKRLPVVQGGSAGGIIRYHQIRQSMVDRKSATWEQIFAAYDGDKSDPERY